MTLWSAVSCSNHYTIEDVGAYNDIVSYSIFNKVSLDKRNISKSNLFITLLFWSIIVLIWFLVIFYYEISYSIQFSSSVEAIYLKISFLKMLQHWRDSNP